MLANVDESLAFKDFHTGWRINFWIYRFPPCRILILRSPPRPRVILRFFISSNTSLVVRESVDMLDTTECLGWVYITELLATLSCTRDCLLTSFRCTSSGTIIFVRYSVNPYISKIKNLSLERKKQNPFK